MIRFLLAYEDKYNPKLCYKLVEVSIRCVTLRNEEA